MRECGKERKSGNERGDRVGERESVGMRGEKEWV